jgi:hypothetical protein
MALTSEMADREQSPKSIVGLNLGCPGIIGMDFPEVVQKIFRSPSCQFSFPPPYGDGFLTHEQAAQARKPLAARVTRESPAPSIPEAWPIFGMSPGM